jgi:hypothetical protein
MFFNLKEAGINLVVSKLDEIICRELEGRSEYRNLMIRNGRAMDYWEMAVTNSLPNLVLSHNKSENLLRAKIYTYFLHMTQMCCFVDCICRIVYL